MEKTYYPILKQEDRITQCKEDKEARIRYKSIIGRNYLQKLNYFLYEVYTETKKIEDLNTTTYEVSDDLKNDYKNMYGNMQNVRKRNVKFKELKLEFGDEIKKDKKQYFKYYENNILTLDDFCIFWNKTDNRSCQYCGVSENQIKNDIDIKTKRFYSRGKTMEIDKKDPFKWYTKDNIILSCYWCNNAKTDEFNLDEFQYIAKGIHTIWEKRLKTEIRFPVETYFKSACE